MSGVRRFACATARAMNSRSLSLTAGWSSPTYVRYTGKLATISPSARVRLPSVKSRRGAVLLGDGVQPVREHVQLGGHRDLHDEPLAFVDDLREGGALLDEAGVQAAPSRAPGCDRRRCRSGGSETRTRWSRQWPSCPGQRLAGAQDLLGDDVEVAARRRARRRARTRAAASGSIRPGRRAHRDGRPGARSPVPRRRAERRGGASRRRLRGPPCEWRPAR